MVVRVPVKPALLTWAADRSGLERDVLSKRFPKLDVWESGDLDPTFNQLQDFASATHAPLGFLFLDAPPEEPLPIPDFRTIKNASLRRASPDLLDTIYLCQMRQDWYREHAIAEDYDPVPFVGSVSVGDPVERVADDIRRAIRFGLDERSRFSNGEAALRGLIDLIEDTGVLVMVSGIVGSNTHRGLDVDEFRGFALSDPVAPLIFVNGADTKAAQIFTLIHELVHVWSGDTALSDARMAQNVANDDELWANQVAAEVLVPLESIAADYTNSDVVELERLAKRYRVSTLVVLKRIYDAGFLSWKAYREQYDEEQGRIMAIVDSSRQSGSGGNYYYTQPIRISRQFARAVIVDALEGRTLYRDAYHLLGAAKHETFTHLAAELGVAP
ncbi:ImmA/IrrE family metallo-endopeptidase [Homoserinibacter sp. GY 40078]|uniref:ImmA/IrrE family metallo-endopeptidase n=1 Tax=Homoserinibacter sp. GY 40078 TaxID=2603275 RepID=UPI0011CCAC0B|nr:ImmA/IrrE family metallo-endopeptidase [Homoserinibacter sp. GY 40078]TXK18808.1 ImmA/IrrE family metallo-endopeptidase [Homoserinibacter sp. GY 40078]